MFFTAHVSPVNIDHRTDFDRLERASAIPLASVPLLRQPKDFLTFGGLNLDLFLRHAEVDELPVVILCNLGQTATLSKVTGCGYFKVHPSLFYMVLKEREETPPVPDRHSGLWLDS